MPQTLAIHPGHPTGFRGPWLKALAIAGFCSAVAAYTPAAQAWPSHTLAALNLDAPRLEPDRQAGGLPSAQASAEAAEGIDRIAANAPDADGGLLRLAPGSSLTLKFSPGTTLHFNHDPEHEPVVLLGLERRHADDRIDGLALFSNSFGQPSFYLYPWGAAYDDFLGVDKLTGKWTAGLLYGYKGRFKDKVPLNTNAGFSPGLVVGLDYPLSERSSLQLNMLGTAAVMLQLNWRLR